MPSTDQTQPVSPQALAKRLMQVAREMQANGVEQAQVIERVLAMVFEGMQDRDDQIVRLERAVALLTRGVPHKLGIMAREILDAR